MTGPLFSGCRGDVASRFMEPGTETKGGGRSVPPVFVLLGLVAVLVVVWLVIQPLVDPDPEVDADRLEQMLNDR